MKYNRPIVLSIAGFDPTGGAGVLADVKTFEQHHCLGFGILSATTLQTETQVISVNWLSDQQIISQLEPLVSQNEVAAIKIGVIEQVHVLKKVVGWLRERISDIFIVWDPVLSASGGMQFFAEWEQEKLFEVLKSVDLITPNALEVCRLASMDNESDAAEKLSSYCHVLLKGGHSVDHPGADRLFSKGVGTNLFEAKGGNCFPKHGSGCILSSAIAANIALGKSLDEACRLGKEYIEKRLQSNEHLLAYHAE